MPLGEQIALEPFEPPDRLVQQAADLRDVTRDGTLERAGVTYDVAGCTMVATDGS